MKTCGRCGVAKPLSAFTKRTDSRDGFNAQCKLCCNERNRADYYAKQGERISKRQEWRDANPTYFFARDLQRKYGITLDEYNALVAEQGGLCACCGSDDPGGRSTNDRFHVDHDHETGRIRGLLCHKCNTGIGILGDSVDGLTTALTYLLSTRDVLSELSNG